MKYLFLISMLAIGGCQQAYFATMEKFGVAKREILVDRVEDARDAQLEGQQQFKDALDELSQLLNFDGAELQTQYEVLSQHYTDSKKAAELIRNRVNKVESVANALFDEWTDELDEFQSQKLKQQSQQQLSKTKRQFTQLLAKMRAAERKTKPVLSVLNDNVLYLKHNLNAKAIGAVQQDFSGLQRDVQSLIQEMNNAISESNKFIAELKL